MGEVISFPKPNPDRDTARLIQEARALYESVFPTENGPAKRATGEARTDLAPVPD